MVLRLPYWRLFCRPEASRSSLASVGTTGARPGRSGAFKLANAASRIGAALWPEAVLQPVPGRSPNIWQSSTLTSRFCSSRDDIIRRRCGHLSARPSVSSAAVHARRPIGLSAPVVEGVMSRISNSSAAAIFTVNGGTRMARRARRQRCRSTATASTAPRRAQTNPWLGSQPRPTNKRRRLRRPLYFASPLLPHCPELNPQENPVERDSRENLQEPCPQIYGGRLRKARRRRPIPRAQSGARQIHHLVPPHRQLNLIWKWY